MFWNNTIFEFQITKAITSALDLERRLESTLKEIEDYTGKSLYTENLILNSITFCT